MQRTRDTKTPPSRPPCPSSQRQDSWEAGTIPPSVPQVTEEKQSRSLCPAASAAYAQSWRRGSLRTFWSSHEPARGEQRTCVRVLPGSLPQGLRTLAGSWSRDIYIREEGQPRAWPTRRFLSIGAMGAGAEPEQPRGRPVTHNGLGPSTSPGNVRSPLLSARPGSAVTLLIAAPEERSPPLWTGITLAAG